MNATLIIFYSLAIATAISYQECIRVPHHVDFQRLNPGVLAPREFDQGRCEGPEGCVPSKWESIQVLSITGGVFKDERRPVVIEECDMLNML